MLWRVCRGNVYLRQDEVEEALEDHLLCEEAEKKSAFLIFFQVNLDRFSKKKCCLFLILNVPAYLNFEKKSSFLIVLI